METPPGSWEPAPVRCVRYTPESRHLAVCPVGSEKVTIFETWSIKLLKDISVQEEFEFAQTDDRSYGLMALSPDGLMLAAFRTPFHVPLRGLADRSFGTVDAAGHQVRKISFAPDGKSPILALLGQKELGKCIIKAVNAWEK